MSAIGRREFLAGLGGVAGSAAVIALGAPEVGAQAPAQQNFGPMDQSVFRPTIRPAKPGATPSMTVLERDALEKRLKCQCGCILDVYTCRTTDFTCQISPAMHRDVLRLVEGGYTGDEILEAFVETYGEVALTSPKKEGFNWAGYFAPAVVMGTGAVVLTVMIRKWSMESRMAAVAAGAAAKSDSTIDATAAASADELARLERAMRDDH